MEMKFNLQPAYYRSIPDCPGIYHFRFPDGMMYVGSTCHLSTRILQHYKAIKEQTFDWHYEAREALDLYSEEKNQELSASFFKDTEIQIQVTKTTEEARLLEKEALFQIYQKQITNKYYNTQYYIKQNGNYKCFNK